MKLLSFQPSIGGRVTFGYYAVALLMLAASLFFVGELRALEERVILGQRVMDLFDSALEIRRFERNYFLHHQDADREENGRYIVKLRSLLSADRSDFMIIATASRLSDLQTLLDAYQRQMADYAAADPRRSTLIEPAVRALGKDIVTIAEDMVAAERRQTQVSLASFRIQLLGVIVAMALAIIGVGGALSRRVVGPLKAMEASVEAVSAGRRDTLLPPSGDREIVSIITAFNHMLKELDQRQKSLMRSERLAALGTMLSGVAHELNNPLSNISTSCQILQEELGEGDLQAQRMFLDQIDQQVVRARNIVRSLQDFAREKEFRKETVFLKTLVEQTVGFVRGEVPAKALVSLAIPEELALQADAQRLQQVFVNLIRNAVDVLDESGRIVISAGRKRVEGPPADHAWGSGCGGSGEMVEISVADNGPGIPADILPRIFDPFFTTKDVGRGMGLGLSIVYEIVDEHGGCIFVNSVPGKGSTFFVRLPAP
ncbi:MAG: HAMP domain-containing sensor histidine kinase [Rhodocyclaceae bacterium]|nr:HAMP domain-containing sensor histidine kinase [Rhodocyclaceae bacterium]